MLVTSSMELATEETDLEEVVSPQGREKGQSSLPVQQQAAGMLLENSCLVDSALVHKNELTSKRLNLKHLDTRLTDKQIDEVIDGLQKDFDSNLKERKKREQQLDDYKMTAFMLIVSTALAVVTIG